MCGGFVFLTHEIPNCSQTTRPQSGNLKPHPLGLRSEGRIHQVDVGAMGLALCVEVVQGSPDTMANQSADKGRDCDPSDPPQREASLMALAIPSQVGDTAR